MYPQTYQSQVILGGKVFNVEVADTKMLLEKGLSGHAPLGQYEGMFFVFQDSNKHGFWMKDMLFSIDIIWIDENLKVVHIEKSVSPQTYPTVFFPTVPARFVLEISAGEAQRLSLDIGDTAQFTKK